MTYHETEWDRASRYYRNELKKVERPLSDRAITEEEYKQLIAQYWDLDPFRIIWQMLWESGARGTEVCWQQLGHIDFKEHQIIYVVGKPKTRNGIKIHKSRPVPMSADLEARLKAFIKLNWGYFRQGFLFPSPALQSKYPHIHPRTLNNEIDRLRPILKGRWLLKFEDPPHEHILSPHCFRRTWITRYINKNPDTSIFQIAHDVGHDDPKTTLIYFQSANKERMQVFVNESVPT